ncbi:hypothetical protein GTA51_04760 [Desulfovibrio aerotolerans]|uniref:Tetratricopeptide repeat protein n=1 Tax=Solidesulfovibrio aerotolerans TaxID=295255 RepID=A0A7C9MI77_9BACT|nr:hypothetical protein [Solidesulfovibrio aerotolerans]MYL82449.1 hypothetical protein [Solidesulfovibrio aerotolerans]
MRIQKNIALFERLWLGSLAIGLLLFVFDGKAANPFISTDLMFVFQVLAAASNAWIVLLVSRKKSKTARYLVFISFVAGAAMDLPGLIDMSVRGMQWLLTAAQYAMQAVGLYYLVTAKSVNPSRHAESAVANSKILDCALGLLESEKYTAAITLFTGIIESDPGNLDAYCGRGICFMRLGNTEKGLADIRLAALQGNIPALALLRQEDRARP